MLHDTVWVVDTETVDIQGTSAIVLKSVDAHDPLGTPPPRRVVAWAYVARKADGTLAYDDGGTTIVNGKAKHITDRDVVDTPEALRAFEDGFYDFIGSGLAGADDMHEDFHVAKIVGGLVLTPELTAKLITPQAPYQALVEKARAVLARPDVGPGAKNALTELVTALEAFPERALPTGALTVTSVPHTPRGDRLWQDLKTGRRRQMSVVATLTRMPVEHAA